MALLTSAALEGYRMYTKRALSYAKYKIDDTYYQSKIESVEITSDGLVEVSFKMELSSGSGIVTQIQLYDIEQNVWLSKTENLKMDSVAEGFYYVVQLDISEKE